MPIADPPVDPGTTPEQPPKVGDLVLVRSRQWLVEEVAYPPEGGSAQVSLACADDDAQGQALTVFWDCELDRRILQEESWADLAGKGFDSPRYFAAFFNTLRWNCATATDPALFQAPFRAGIQLDAYQMEPLRKALRLPRVNLFIADDTGLGKTIEAGLVARELLLRRKAKRIVVAAPPSVLEQWKMELEDRFGLLFEILDRAYVSRMRRERGFGVNPWRTHTRFLVSHNLLIDPAYADPLREWLGDLLPGSLLILDEAHHAAPSSGGRYGIETKITRAVRDLGSRFEHRLFLSATPHNGHSNSFSTLLELLDPYRFTRGVKVRGKRDLEDVMVRRLKEDIRDVRGGFPKRNVVRLAIDGLPEDAPELALSRLLDEYRRLRERRFANAPPKARTAAGLLVVGLQQRLLSSVEAFARSLRVHARTVQRQWQKEQTEHGDSTLGTLDQALFLRAPDADDERAEWDEKTAESAEQEQVKALSLAAGASSGNAAAAKLWRHEQALIERMSAIAEEARHKPDAKTRRLIDWIRANQVPDLPPFGERPTGPAPAWNERRVLIFTENREGTKRYLKRVLEQAIEHTEDADDRIAVIDGLTSGPRRKDIQRRFNANPRAEPLRILIATDAAREGLNFQARCADLFHFDLPWNPGRIEQRNGRIDRKLQPAAEVNCHYFALPQRAEDRVLEVLVRKTATIKRELGSLAQVIDDDVERRLRGGIRHDQAEPLRAAIEQADLAAGAKRSAAEELEDARERRDALEAQIERCRTVLDRSRDWAKFNEKAFRDALSCALELLDAPPLRRRQDVSRRTIWEFPDLERRAPHRPELDGDPRLPAPPAQARREARRVAQGGADSPRGVQGSPGVRRRHRPPALGTARRPASFGAVPRPRLRLQRPLPRLPRAKQRLHPPRDSARPPGALRPRRRAPARGTGARHRPLDRAEPAGGSAARLRPRHRNAHSGPAGRIPQPPRRAARRGRARPPLERRARRRGSAAPAAGATRPGTGRRRPRPTRRTRQGRGRATCGGAAPAARTGNRRTRPPRRQPPTRPGLQLG